MPTKSLSIVCQLKVSRGAAAEAVRVMIEGASLPLYEAIKLETEAFMRLAGVAGI